MATPEKGESHKEKKKKTLYLKCIVLPVLQDKREEINGWKMLRSKAQEMLRSNIKDKSQIKHTSKR